MPKNLEISDIPIEDIVPYAQNARTHSDRQVNQIAASIKEFGFLCPVVIDRKNILITGHARLPAPCRRPSVPAI